MEDIRVEYLADFPEAVALVAGWLFQEWGHNARNRTLEGMTGSLRKRLNRDSLPLALVALQGDLPVGTVSLKLREVETRPQYAHWLGSLFVPEAQRRMGVGSRLVEAAWGEANRQGIDELYLYTRQIRSQRLYERLGWVEVEHLEYRGRPAVVMNMKVK